MASVSVAGDSDSLIDNNIKGDDIIVLLVIKGS